MAVSPYRKGSRKCRVCGKWYDKNEVVDARVGKARWKDKVCSIGCYQNGDYRDKLKKHLDIEGKPACGMINAAFLTKSPRLVNCNICKRFIQRTRKI